MGNVMGNFFEPDYNDTERFEEKIQVIPKGVKPVWQASGY